MKPRSLLILLVPTLSGCASLGLIMAAGIAGAAATKDTAPPEVKVYGPDSAWFDRNLYSVWVKANAPEEAERIAMETASKSCVDRGGRVQIEKSDASQETRFPIPIKIERFSYWVSFRCMIEKSEAS